MATREVVTRAERVAEMRALQAEGLNGLEIAARLGLSNRTVSEYLLDPTGEKTRARKTRGRCADCGTPIRSDQPGKGNPKRCIECAALANTKWTREAVVEAIQVWAAEHGGRPPAAIDWNGVLAREYGREERDMERFPGSNTVQDVFGSWNAAIEAAGFEPRASFSKSAGPGSLDPAVVAETVRLREQGLTLAEIGRRMGVTATAIRYRLISHGHSRLCPDTKGGGRMAAPLKAVTALDREIERYEARAQAARDRLKEEEAVVEQLRQARAALAGES